MQCTYSVFALYALNPSVIIHPIRSILSSSVIPLMKRPFRVDWFEGFICWSFTIFSNLSWTCITFWNTFSIACHCHIFAVLLIERCHLLKMNQLNVRPKLVHVQYLLAHLSRRLIGELIVYKGIRRPSVRPSVNIFKRHLL